MMVIMMMVIMMLLMREIHDDNDDNDDILSEETLPSRLHNVLLRLPHLSPHRHVQSQHGAGKCSQGRHQSPVNKMTQTLNCDKQ